MFQDSFLTLSCANLATSIEFYRALLGQPPAIHRPDHYGEFHLPGLRLALFVPRPDHAAEFASSHSGPMSLCLEVSDLDDAIAHLTHIGYPPPSSPITASHGREIYAYDPDGNRLIFHERR